MSSDFWSRREASVFLPAQTNKKQPPSKNQQINELAQLLDCVADVLWCSVCGCLLTQHHVELDARDKAGGALAYMAQQPQHAQQAAMRAPAPQQIAMGQGGAAAPPAPAGYPAQYGAAPAGYPQMQR